MERVTFARYPAPRRTRNMAPRLFVYAVLLLLSAFMVFPFLWMLVSSFKPFSEIFAGTAFLPQNPTLHNYTSLFEQSDALHKIWNSLYIAATSTVLSVFLCALGG